MPFFRHAKALLHTAALLLVLAAIGHVHGHRCMDGQEPEVAVHFENFKHHPHHADGEHAGAVEHAHDADASHHNDIENELMPQGLLAKSLDYDAPLFLLVTLVLPLPQVREPQQYSTTDTLPFLHPPSALLPPLRAPPVLS